MTNISPASDERLANAIAALGACAPGPDALLRAALEALSGLPGAEKCRIGHPISTNQSYRNVPGTGRVMTAAYRKWRRSEAWNMRLSWSPRAPIDCPVVVAMAIPGPKRMDADNAIKPYLDAMQDAGVLADDKHVRHFIALWTGEPPNLGRAVFVPMEAAT